MKKANLKRIISAICLLGMLSSLTACANEPVSSEGTVSDENAAADMEKNPAENNGETPPEKPDGEPGQNGKRYGCCDDLFNLCHIHAQSFGAFY